MLDLHVHILPAVDDGPDNSKESLKMAETASKKNIKRIVATPHFRGQIFSVPKIKTKIRELQGQIDKRNLELKIFPGSEVFISQDLGLKLEKNKIISLNNSHYVLVEFPFGKIPDYLGEVIYDLKIMNYNLIIAHPERYLPVISDIGCLHKLLQKDNIFAQLNLGSLRGKYGSKIKKTAVKLIKNNFIQFLGSDAHSQAQMKQDYEEGMKVLNEIDDEYIKKCDKNFRKVLNDEILKIPPPEFDNSKTFLGKLKNIFFVDK